MTTNVEARRQALTKYGARIVSFVQPMGLCDGLVSWWLRSRLKDKPFFESTRFTPVATNHTDPPGVTGRYSIGTQKVPKEDWKPGMVKADALQQRFRDTLKDRKYITDGIRDDKPDAASDPAGSYINSKDALQLSDNTTIELNCNTLRDIVNIAKADRNLIKLRIAAPKNTTHSVGLDLSPNAEVHYFDPNIGEFIFPDVDKFLNWWIGCYLEYKSNTDPDKKKDAFSVFKYSFSVDYYKHL